MKFAAPLAVLVAALALPAPAAAIVDASVFAQLPSCAVNCLVASMGVSSCSLSNTTCMCLDKKLQHASEVCTLANCTVVEALTAKNITAIGCGTPVRDRGDVFRVTTTTFACIAAAFVLSRFIFRIFIARTRIGMDDWMALAAVVVGIPSNYFNIHGLASNGLGRDIWTLELAQIYGFLRAFYIIQIHYFVDVTLLKLTLLFFFLRIFPAQGVRRIIWGTIAFVILFGLCFLFLGIFQCTPIAAYWTFWDGKHPGSRCLDPTTIGWANAAISIALDIWMLGIPLWQLRKLRLHWKKKFGVGFMFVFGTFVTVVSILRLQTLLSFSNSENATWDNYDIITWSTIEINVGIICACLPTTRLILVHFYPRILGSSTDRYYNNNNNNNYQDYYASGGPGGPGALSGDFGEIGAAGSRAPRSYVRRSRPIPLSPTSPSYHGKGAGGGAQRAKTVTTVTATHADKAVDDDSSLNSDDAVRRDPVVDVRRPDRDGHHGHFFGDAPGIARPGAIIYSKTYKVEYGTDYHDEAQLFDDKHGAKSPDSKSDAKSEGRSSQSSL